MDLWYCAQFFALECMLAVCAAALATPVAGLIAQNRYGGALRTSQQVRDAGFDSILDLLGAYDVIGAISTGMC